MTSRRPARVAGAIAAATMVLAAPTSANAQCSSSGTVPGQPASVTAVSAGGETIYVDDRGLIDIDHNDETDAGGIWIYRESNGRQGLQRGGEHVTKAVVPRRPSPPIQPIVLLPPDPSRPVLQDGLILFPNGFGGCSGHCESFWWEDPCAGPGDHPGDTLIF